MFHSSSFSFFSAPSRGREILAGFSYLQRIGKGARTRAWVPASLRDKTIEWAAVREFDLVQEADNLAIDDLDVCDLKRTFQALQKMRAGGYCIVTLALGRYAEDGAQDDLKILDAKLQKEITQMVQFLYLGEQSAVLRNAALSSARKDTWCCADALPSLARAINERRLFMPGKETAEESCFFEMLERLPAKHVLHDVAVGLALPDATKEKNWTYIAKGEQAPLAFFSALGTTMGDAIRYHPRGAGYRLTPTATAWQRRSAACALLGG